ncbi:hypothetical protein BCD48_19020 [Pseudofrankia sp. BMG5.36]|nr:hypothetical protein BCD48_19020 [Pseudofrankia sp. BMG5.36]
MNRLGSAPALVSSARRRSCSSGAGTDRWLSFSSRISFADLADFMLAQLTRDDLVRQAVAVTS